MSAFGQDTLDALFWTATEPGGRKRDRISTLIFHLFVALTSVFIHATIVLLQSLALNVAINADNKGLLTILISNNFTELKGSVLKKTDRLNLLQVSCSDVRERFHLGVLMVLVALQTLKEYSWSEERLYILLPDCLLVCGTEVLVDWIKHAFMTRCNDIPIEAYREYTTILAHDLVMCKQKYADSDHSDLVARRMGFMPLPLGVVTFRILSQCLPLKNFTAFLLIFLAFAAIITFRVLNGIVMLGKACDIIKDAERRKEQADTTFDMASASVLVTDKPSNGASTSVSSVSALHKNSSSFSDADPSFLSSSCTSGCSSGKTECCSCCSRRTTEIPTQKTDEEDGLAYLTPVKSNSCFSFSTPLKANLETSSEEVFTSEEVVVTGGFTTPFDSPTHLVKRHKSKRVRLISGAMVQEIEPYINYSIEDDNESTLTEDPTKLKNDLRLNLSQFSETKDGESTSKSVSSSPRPYDDSSSMSFGLNSQDGLMANSNVNLASVGINEGPHSPIIGNESSGFSSPERENATSLDIVPSIGKNVSETVPGSSADSKYQLDDSTNGSLSDTSKTKDTANTLGDKTSGKTQKSLNTDEDRGYNKDCDSSSIQESSLAHSFRAVSAPDVRIQTEDSDNEG